MDSLQLDQSHEKKSSSSSRHLYCAAVLIVLLLVAVVVMVAVLLANQKECAWDAPVSDDDATPRPKSSLSTTPGQPASTSSPTSPPSTRSPSAPRNLPFLPKDDGTGFGAYRFAGVASFATVCSSVGTDILARQGGTAVDSAIATMLCVCVLYSPGCGIGGGHFANIYAKPRGSTQRQALTILAREVAPLSATQLMYKNASSVRGGMAIGVPGEVMGFYEAWKRFGRLPWALLFQPTIRLCRDGMHVPEAMAFRIRSKETIIRNQTKLRDLLMNSDGNLYVTGDLMKRPRLAVTLEKIAADPMTFYNGSLAQDIVDDIQEAGGIITREDLRQYAPRVGPPVNQTLTNGQFTLMGPPPPSSGVVMGFIMKILDGYNFTNMSVATPEARILTYHRITEAMKFAYSKRSALGDAKFVNVTELLANMTSSTYTESIRQKINDSFTQKLKYYEPSFEIEEDSGTTHLSILAPDGSAVSMTCTINTIFGSKVVGSRTGIIFNNEMDDFSTPGTSNAYGVAASPSNYIEPGKMPMSSMSPMIFLNKDGDVVYVSGASGGTRITSGVANVAVHALWMGDRVDSASSRGRLHHQLLPNRIHYEAGVDKDLLQGLQNKGHNITLDTKIWATVNSVHNTCLQCQGECSPKNCIHASSDPRSDGKPDGY